MPVKISFPLEYKFVLYNKKERRAVAWENNPNRYMADPQIAANETLAVGDRYVYFNLPAWKGSGVAVPVFSLRSEKSFGVGDFGDLKRMIDWAVATNQKGGADSAHQRHYHDAYLDRLLPLQ